MNASWEASVRQLVRQFWQADAVLSCEHGHVGIGTACSIQIHRKKNVGHGTPYITNNATVTYNATDSVICSPGYKSYATRVITSPALVSCVFCWIAR